MGSDDNGTRILSLRLVHVVRMTSVLHLGQLIDIGLSGV